MIASSSLGVDSDTPHSSGVWTSSSAVLGVALFVVASAACLPVGTVKAQTSPTYQYQNSDRASQSEQERERGVEGESPSASPGQLPDWAAPSEPRQPNTQQRAVETRAPDPPGNPSRIPVDGGLTLLAAAGMGYAIRRLNGDDRDSNV